MERMMRITNLAIGMIVVACGALAKDQPETKRGNGRSAIVGTWRLTVTPYICGTSTSLPSFHAFTTYGREGILTGVANSPHFLPGQRTPEFGVWERVAPNTYRATREAFILFPSPQPGLVRGTQHIEEDTVVRGNTLRTEAVSELRNEAGVLVMSGCARIAGQLME